MNTLKTGLNLFERISRHWFAILAVCFVQLHPSAASARPLIDIEMTKDWKIWLRGPTCADLQPQLAAFATWRERLGEAPTSTQSSCDCSGARCKIEVSAVLPTFAKKVLGIFPENDGPNCWNTSLVSANILPFMRGTDANEFTYWMNSPLCTKLAPGATPEPGDIMAIRSNFGKVEQHAFIYATAELSFSKKNFEAAEPYLLLSTDEIYGRPYKIRKECQGVETAGCETQVHAYRCMNLPRYLSDKTVSAQTQLRVSQVERTEKQLETKLFTSADDYQGAIGEAAKRQAKLVSADLKSAPSGSVDELILKGLMLRTQSIVDAMKNLK